MNQGTGQDNEREDRPVLLKLSGEFDVRYQRTLEDILSGCVGSGRPAFIDLSEVTFMDSRCLRELAIHYLLGDGRVVLFDPSWEVKLSVAACDLEGWLDFVYMTDLAFDEEQERLANQTLRLVQDGEVVTRVGHEASTRYTCQQLSTMIGSRRKTASRAFGRLRLEDGTVLRNGRILVIDTGALTQFAGG